MYPNFLLAFSHLITELLTWNHLVFYAYLNNSLLRRLETLGELASSENYRKHVVADGLQDFVQEGMYDDPYITTTVLVGG